MFRRIFVYYNRGVQTGGPEALHQLVAALRELGQDAYLVPIPGTENKPRHPAYEHYGAPETGHIEDLEDCAIVVPEGVFSLLNRVKLAAKYCWWLSIDFSEHFFSERRLLSLAPTHGIGDLKRLKHSLLKTVWDVKRRFIDYGKVIHLTQSQYAWSFLVARLNIVPSMLSDFTLVSEFSCAFQSDIDRGQTVAFNYSKGAHWVKLVERECPEIAFIPIRNMSRAQVVSTLSSSAVYLDLGHHPGKDRLPREAALAGAVTVVARRGAAAYWDDVPIPWEHKASMTSLISNTVEILRSVLSDAPSARAKQSSYVSHIRAERQRFSDEIEAVFVRGILEFGSEGAPHDSKAVWPGSSLAVGA